MNLNERHMDIKLANGYIVGLYTDKGNIFLELVNPNGYIVSDKKLDGGELHKIKRMIEVVSDESK